jgi:hypothetical protein
MDINKNRPAISRYWMLLIRHEFHDPPRLK